MTDMPVTPDVLQEEPVASEPDTTPPVETSSKPEKTVEQLQAELAKTRNEAAGYRVKLKELEPLAKKQLDADEAKKDGEQKALERAQAAEKALELRDTDFARLQLAVTHHISDPDDVRMIGSGSREEMEANAKRIATLNAAAAKATPPPTDRPVEGLRPGASPEPANPPDDSYPESWKQPWMRGNDKESRIQHGQ